MKQKYSRNTYVYLSFLTSLIRSGWNPFYLKFLGIYGWFGGRSSQLLCWEGGGSEISPSHIVTVKKVRYEHHSFSVQSQNPALSDSLRESKSLILFQRQGLFVLPGKKHMESLDGTGPGNFAWTTSDFRTFFRELDQRWLRSHIGHILQRGRKLFSWGKAVIRGVLHFSH